jgi:versiconal hemiacetal acetate esterase
MLLNGSLSSCQEGYARIGGLLVYKYEFPPPDPGVQTEDITIPAGLEVRIYMPKGYNGGSPMGVYYHGGGWAMGDLDGEDAIVRTISKGGDAVVVSVEYGLVPQNKHPDLINDCWKALQWTLKNAGELGGVDGKVFISGASAGARLALGVALKAIYEGLGDSVVGAWRSIEGNIRRFGRLSRRRCRDYACDCASQGGAERAAVKIHILRGA